MIKVEVRFFYFEERAYLLSCYFNHAKLDMNMSLILINCCLAKFDVNMLFKA